MRLGIVADDLTGACDTALQFHSAGHLARVALRNSLPLPQAEAVLACDSDSRDCAPPEAYARTRSAVEQLHALGLHQIYKKVDSTLRGNIGSELDALLDASDAPAVVLAPSFPQAGRLVRGGQLYVHGIPLDDTPFAAALPLRSSSVAAIVGARASAQVAHLVANEFLGHDELLYQKLTRLASTGARIIGVDACSDDELRSIARVAHYQLGWPLAGSAGLAAALAAERPGSAAPHPAPRAHGPVVVLIGSRSPVAAAQLAHLRQQPQVQAVLVDGGALLGKHRAATIQHAREQLGVALQRGHDCVVASDPRAAAQTNDPALARAVAAGLAAIMAPMANTLGGLVATGGDTAAAALAQLGVGALELAGAVEAGVPIMQAVATMSGLPIVTKAGGFGDDATLTRALQALH
jgi:D-threonate/D-erythronate kinase